MPLIDYDHAQTFNASTTFHYARDFESRITPNATQRTTLIVAGCYIVAIAILW